MSTEIYYFSGTGNSLYVARELQKLIPDTSLIPIVSLLHKDVVPTHGESIGFVFPVHALTIPLAVKKFLRKIDLRDSKYLFAVATREGTVFRGFEVMDQLLRRKKRRLDSHFLLNMYGSDPRGAHYRTPTDADISSLETGVQEKLESIRRIVTAGGFSREKDCEYLIEMPENPFQNFLLEKSVLLGMTVAEYIGGVNYFYADAKCTGCGICEKVCLSQKIRMVDKRPVWQREVLCYMCYACVNFCPRQAVQVESIPGVKSRTTTNGRYSHPYATVADIAAQKRRD